MKDYHLGEIYDNKSSQYKLFNDRIVSLEDASEVVESNSIFIISISWNCSKFSLNIINKFNEIYSNIIVLTNTLYEEEFYRKATNVDVLFCNSNAFLDETVYNIDKSIKKKYNLIVNSCFKSFKRVKFANKLNNVLHIGYYNGEVNKYIPDFGTIANYHSGEYNHLKSHEIANYINSSYIGGIFSKEEGACYASTEYLLCGIPVLSTESKGGRDIWYNEENSIICHEDNVNECFNTMKQNIDSGMYDPVKIRDDCLVIMNQHRIILAEYIQNKLIQMNAINIPDIQSLKTTFSYFNCS
jgi:glycosyltransferase involved in cell wall biosynthesis